MISLLLWSQVLQPTGEVLLGIAAPMQLFTLFAYEQQGYALIRSHQFAYMYVNKKQAVQCLITIQKSAECNLLLVI